MFLHCILYCLDVKFKVISFYGPSLIFWFFNIVSIDQLNSTVKLICSWLRSPKNSDWPSQYGDRFLDHLLESLVTKLLDQPHTSLIILPSFNTLKGSTLKWWHSNFRCNPHLSISKLTRKLTSSLLCWRKKF